MDGRLSPSDDDGDVRLYLSSKYEVCLRLILSGEQCILFTIFNICPCPCMFICTVVDDSSPCNASRPFLRIHHCSSWGRAKRLCTSSPLTYASTTYIYAPFLLAVSSFIHTKIHSLDRHRTQHVSSAAATVAGKLLQWFVYDSFSPPIHITPPKLYIPRDVVCSVGGSF